MSLCHAHSARAHKLGAKPISKGVLGPGDRVPSVSYYRDLTLAIRTEAGG